jgi:hypothetical protein
MGSRAGSRFAAAALAVVVAALAIVALASRPPGAPGGPVLADAASRVVADVFFYLLGVVLLIGLALVVWVLWPRKDDDPIRLPPRQSPRMWTLPLALLAILAAATALGLRLRRRSAAARLAGVPKVGGTLPAGHAGATGVDWLALAISAVLVLAAALLVWRALRRPPIRPRQRERAVAEIEQVLDHALEDLLAEVDPRRAVIAAWARLERVLEGHGLGRRRSEAPFEYAGRAGAALELHRVRLERLAELFEWARFSPHEVTGGMRQEALEALTTVRDGLRDAA